MSTRRFDDLVTTVAKLRRQIRDLEAKALRRIGTHDHDRAYPLGVVGYAETTGVQDGITSETNITDLSVTVDVAAGRRLRIEHYIGNVRGTNVGDRATLRIRQDGTQIQNRHHVIQDTSAGGGGTMVAYETPGAGTFTFKVTLQRTSGTGSVGHAAAGSAPGHLVVEDIGTA